MRHFTSLILLLLAAIIPASAQLLWKVEGNGLTSPSFIFGTHHIAPADMAQRVDGLFDAIEAVDAIYGEVDMTNLNPMEIQQMTMAHVMAPADSTLSTLFTPAQLDSISEIMTRYAGVPFDASTMNAFKPVMLSTQLAILQAMQAFPDFDPQSQLDATIQGMGRAGGKKTAGLETIEYQLNVLYDTPIAEQASDLIDAVRNDSTAIANTRRLAQAYLAADLTSIEELLYDDPEMTAEKLDKLLLERNRAWAAQLPAIMAETPTLVVVGCGHLVGPEGIIRLLQDQGYTVTPVASQTPER